MNRVTDKQVMAIFAKTILEFLTDAVKRDFSKKDDGTKLQKMFNIVNGKE